MVEIREHTNTHTHTRIRISTRSRSGCSARTSREEEGEEEEEPRIFAHLLNIGASPPGKQTRSWRDGGREVRPTRARVSAESCQPSARGAPRPKARASSPSSSPSSSSAEALTFSLICRDTCEKSAGSCGHGEARALTDKRIFSCACFLLKHGECEIPQPSF